MLASAQVRQFVAQALTACAVTGGRVFEGRYHPADESELPCWFVAIDPGEDIEHQGDDGQGASWPQVQQHRLRLRAEGLCVSADALETLLDTLQVQGLEALFSTQPPFALHAVGVRRRVDDGDASKGALAIHLEATFLTVEGQPETLI